jgi:bacterioferritin-associated ferredoxin
VNVNIDYILALKIFKGENIMDNDKVICGCINVKVQDLKDAIDNGAKSFEEVQATTKVGTGCGKCTDSVKVLVDELLGK